MNALVPWARVLDVLHVPHPSPVLPATVQCPLCKAQQLDVWQDQLSGGQWYHCRKCKSAGDMIELAAAAWGLSLPATLQKLTQQGLDLTVSPALVRFYLRDHVDCRKRLRQLWRQSQTHLYQDSTTLRALLSELRVPFDFPAERAQSGPAQILGGCTHTAAELAFSPHCTRPTQEHFRGSTSPARIFKGPKWNEVLVIPFYDVPRRHCGFGFIGRGGDMSKDYAFKTAPVNVGGPEVQRNAETGLAFHPGVWEIAKEWGRTIFAVSDPLLYLRFQMRQFERSLNPLPLVLWQERTRAAWTMFQGYKIVFWDRQASLATMQQVVQTNGWLSTAGPIADDPEAVHNYLLRYVPSMLCEQLRKTARPWPLRLASLMRGWTDAQVEELLLQLHLEQDQLQRLLKSCDERVRSRVTGALQTNQLSGSIRLESRTFVEQSDGWYCHRTGAWARELTLVVDAKLRIDQVIVHRAAGKTTYCGRIIYHNEEIPFATAEEGFEKDPFRWMRQLLLEQGKGVLRYSAGYGKHAITLATGFHEPKLVQGISRVGWDREQLLFNLPNCRIGPDECKPQHETIPDISLPATNLRLTTPPLAENWAPADGYSMSVFWGALAGILHNIVAPAVLRGTCGFGLVGPGATELGLAVAQAMGCLRRELRVVSDVRKASALEQSHHWPLATPVSPLASGLARLQWVEADRSYAHNCVTPLDPTTAAVKKLETSWNLLTAWDPVQITPLLLRLASRLTVGYLQDLCQRRLKLATTILDDLVDFVRRSGGEIDEADKLRELYYEAREEGDATAFADLVGQLVISGQLRIAQEDFANPGDLVRSAQHLFVPQAPVVEQLLKQHILFPERTRVTAVLAHAGVLHTTTSEGWSVDRAWWEARYRSSMGQQSGLLRIVG